MTAALSDAARATVVELYEAGLTLRQVGERVGLSFTTVKMWLLEAGVRPRPSHQRIARDDGALRDLEERLEASVRRAAARPAVDRPAPPRAT